MDPYAPTAQDRFSFGLWTVGNPGRDPEDHRLLMKKIVRPSDGFTWGNRPEQSVE